MTAGVKHVLSHQLLSFLSQAVNVIDEDRLALQRSPLHTFALFDNIRALYPFDILLVPTNCYPRLLSFPTTTLLEQRPNKVVMKVEQVEQQ